MIKASENFHGKTLTNDLAIKIDNPTVISRIAEPTDINTRTLS